MSRLIGVCKFYDESRGFGFLTRDDNNGPDVFAHHSALGGADLSIGDRVSFDVTDGPKGPRAVDVKILDEI